MAILTSASIVALISAFKEPIINFTKETKKELLFFLDNGLPDYLNSLKDKFQYTKTFLYRQENVSFYDVFFPVSIRIQRTAKVVTTCEDLFSENNFVSIIGSAGSGKTMLMKHFFLESIKTCYKIPLFIELRNLNDFNGNFTELIYEVILNNRLSPDDKILERLLESGSFILLLDGYDELFSDRKSSVTNDIDKFIDRYSKNKYIISSRPGSGVESMPRFNNYYVEPLKKKEIEQFVDLLLKSNDDIGLAAKIKQVINRQENKDYVNFLSSPLLLSMFILTFKQYPELPKKKSKFYWNVFDTLATKHDSFTKKGGYQHERKSGLQNEEFEKILKWFSYKSLFEGKINFDAEYLDQTLTLIKKELSMDFDVKLVLEDLTVAISVLVVDGIEYKFPHKSMQEYFTIALIKDLGIDLKQQIYQQKFEQLDRQTTGGSFNLWNLAIELDKYDFTKFFFIFFLREFLSKFENKTGADRIRQIYEVWDIREGFFPRENDDFYFGRSYSYNATLSIYESLFAFLELTSFNITEIISSLDILGKEFKDYIADKANDPINSEVVTNSDVNGDLYFATIHHWDARLENLLMKAGVISSFDDFIISVENKLLSLENEIYNEQTASKSLLGI